MRSSTKAIFALGASLILAIIAFLLLRSFLTVTETVDQGNRGLVVISSSGAQGSVKLVTNSYYARGEDTHLVLFFTSTRRDAEEAPHEKIEFTITFFGSDFEDRVFCGASDDPVQRFNYEDLDAGTQNAAALDATSGRSSALNYDGEDPAELNEALNDGDYYSFSGSVWLSNTKAAYSNRVTAGDQSQYIWAEECRIPNSGWRLPSNGIGPLELPSSAALMPYQLNWTTQQGTLPASEGFDSSIMIERNEGDVLQEGYPPPQAGSSHWSYANPVYWTATSLGYTDQPVWIFSSRSANNVAATLQLFGGLCIGWSVIAGGLAVRHIFVATKESTEKDTTAAA